MEFLRSLRNASPSLAACGFVHTALILVFGILAVVDPRTVLGVNAWIKPLKFALSISTYAFTLAWIASLLMQGSDPAETMNRRLRRLGLVVSLTMYGETIFVALQAGRGVRSHFNHDTPFDDAVYGIMGLMIVINTIAVTLFFLPLFQSKYKTRIAPALRVGLQAGAVIFLVGSIFGGVMSGIDRHTIGGPDGGPGIPGLNWSTHFGDLRIVHALGLHALQILPLIGWWVSRRDSAPMIVGASSIVYAVVFLVITVITLLGRSLIPT